MTEKRLILAGVIIFILAGSQANAQSVNDVSWQSSEHASVQLGVRDKHGTLGSYDATFIVTDARGKKYEKTIKVQPADFGYIVFPDGFGLGSLTGRFSWICVVRGKTVLRGRFLLEVSP